MDVFDLQASINLDTAPYLTALRAARDETERIRTQMSAPITTPMSVPSSPGSGTGGGSGVGGSGLPSVTHDAEEAGKAIDDLNKKLGEGFSTAAKVATGAWATTSAAILAGTKKAVDRFAQYEQLVGGVDTIFKESSEKVQKYADEAYETAGMSANKYMETVTSFSMSLLQGLKGNTEKAADMANLAITDMSDNANKMGTAMESIERAYQGFAKQNYTMLDNLKLGYGGTKAEMERLLEDAEKLSDMKFEITNYSDIIQAIHIIQENLGITGTTAEEAADTIEGSLNSTKAALDNLITGFGRSDADIEKLMGDVEKNISNLAKNAIPVAERAFVTMTKTAISAGKEIAEKLPKLISQAMTDIHKMIADSFGESKTLIFGVETAVKSLTAAFITFKAAAYVADVVDSIKKVNDALKTGVTLTEALNKANLANPWVIAATAAAAFGATLKSVWDIQTDLIEEAVDGYDLLSSAQKEMYDSLKTTLVGVYDSKKAYEESYAAMESSSSAIQKNIDALYELDAQEKLSNEDKTRMKALVDDLNSSVEGLNIKLNEQNGHLETQKKDIDDLIKSYQNQAKSTVLQERLIKLTREQYDLEDKYKDAYNEHAKAMRDVNVIKGQQIDNEKVLNEFYKKNGKDFNLWTKDAQKEYDNLFYEQRRLNDELDAAETKSAQFAASYSDLGSAMREGQEAINGISNELSNLGASVDDATVKITANGDATIGVFNAVKEVAKQLDESTEGFWLNIRDNTRVLSIETAEKVGELIDTYDKLYNAQYESIAKSVDLYKGFEADTSVTYQDLLSNLQQSEFYLNDWTTAIDQLQTKVDKGLMSQQFLDSLKDMGLDSWNIVYNMNHATGEQLKQYSDLWVKTNEEIKTSTDKLTEDQKEATEKKISEITGIAEASIEDYKQAFTDVGVAIGDGLVKGINETVKEAQAAIKEAGEGVIQVGKDVLKVNSPSEEFREIGNYVVEGLIVGIAEKSYLAEETIRKLSQRIIKTAEKELEISSPSKIMREIGGYVSEGFAEGIEDNENRVVDAAIQISKATTDVFSNSNSGIQMSKSSSVNSNLIRTTTTYREDQQNQTIDVKTLTEAFKEALKDLVSGDIIVEGTLDGEKLLEVLFPKIDAMQGKRVEAAIRGYAT